MEFRIADTFTDSPVADEGDLQEVYETERHLLYVACTRPATTCW
jgi:hypothetical protein